jgi:hypothetical protein
VHFRRGLRHWQRGLAKIANETRGIVRVVGILLHVLTLASPPQWAYIGFGTEDRPLYFVTDAYVVGALIASVFIYYFVPDLAWLSTFFSASTLIVMLYIVLLQPVFGPIRSAERSLLLFMFNAAQIVFMFATWYQLLGDYSETEALLKSILTFATIGYADKMSCVAVAMAQIATDFVLLFIFLSFVVSQLGSKNGVK